MSTFYSFLNKQLIVYAATPIFALGIVGAVLNILVFLSLQTFRQSSCAFYLTVASLFHISSLFLGVFSRITVTFLGVDGTETSLFYCKFRLFFNQSSVGIALTCLCFATIDQYLATCSRVQWQQYCSIKLAKRLVLISSSLWILQGIPSIVFFDHILGAGNKVTCVNTNSIYAYYRIFGLLLSQVGILPVVFTTIFGWLAYRNVQHITYRAVPLIRRELDKQLTMMVLVQVFANIFILLPYGIVNAISTNPQLNRDSITQAKVQLAVTITLMLYYSSFAIPFYIYVSVSERFRRQLIYVLITVHLNRCVPQRINVNEVIPMH